MFHILYQRLLVTLIALIVITSNISARWKEYSECDLEVISEKHDIKVKADGSSESIVEYRIKVLNERGRQIIAHHSIGYDKVFTNDIDVIAAKTITNGQTYIVNSGSISTRAISSPDMHFQDNYEISIDFPKVEVGSEIYLVLKRKDKFVFLNHYYNVLGMHYDVIKNYYCKITSELPLYIKVNDPHNVLSVKTDAKNEHESFNIAEVVLKKPLVQGIVNEPYHGVVSPLCGTWVSVSNFNKWEDYNEGYDFFSVLSQKLPQLFANIANEAKSHKTEEAQIAFVMSSIIEKIQYKSDARASKGSMVPRDLAEIASTQIGDCKEFSISTGAILQKLGYKVYPALVGRHNAYKDKPYLPSAYHFNHAIIKVVGKGGKEYWLDPTNIIVSVNKPLPDIAGRAALAFIDNGKASYDYIPQVDHNHAKTINEVTLVKYDDNVASFQGTVTYVGEEAAGVMTGLYQHRHSAKQSEDYLFELVSSRNDLEEKHKKNISLLTKINSRLLQDLSIKYEYDNPEIFYESNMGKVLKISSPSIFNKIVSTTSDQISDILLSYYPVTLEVKLIVKGQKIKNIDNLDYKINTSWIGIDRVCTHVGNDTEIVTTVKVYKHIITNAELKTKEYKMLKEEVEAILLNSAIVLE